MKTNVTPHGDECVVPTDERIIALIEKQARGVYQRRVVKNLLENGYVVGYLADGGPLRGKAKDFKTRYEASLVHLVDRIHDTLGEAREKGLTDLWIVTGEVGPKGAWGCYLIA